MDRLEPYLTQNTPKLRKKNKKYENLYNFVNKISSKIQIFLDSRKSKNLVLGSREHGFAGGRQGLCENKIQNLFYYLNSFFPNFDISKKFFKLKNFN